jgi:hypothetical protein
MSTTQCNECGTEIPDNIDRDLNGQQCAECERESIISIAGVTSSPWPADEASSLRSSARNCWQHYDYPHRKDVDNCGACALEAMSDTEPPNYAGWLRIYLELGRAIPRQHYHAEMEYAERENPRYRDAIMRDIATYGLRWA